jgi:3-oxoacyl-[acyl-carrier-protein] synthase III
VLGDPLLKMDGPAVFKLAVSVLESVARSVLAKAGRTEADIDWLIRTRPTSASCRARREAQARAGKADRHRRPPRQHLGRIDPARP